MTDFHYVYILESVGSPDRFYSGLTDDLAGRLAKHNVGAVSHTANTGPGKSRPRLLFVIENEQPNLSAI